MRSTGYKQDGGKVLEYVRWVMVRKRDEAAPRARRPRAAAAEALLDPNVLGDACPRIDIAAYDYRSPAARTGSATTRSARRSTMSTA